MRAFPSLQTHQEQEEGPGAREGSQRPPTKTDITRPAVAMR